MNILTSKSNILKDNKNNNNNNNNDIYIYIYNTE